MTSTKTAFRSLTVLAAAGAVVVSLAGAFGIAVEPEMARQAVDGVAQLVSAVMAGIAIYGRLRATTRIARGR